MEDPQEAGSNMQVETDDFILSLTSSDAEDVQHQSVIMNEEPNSLPTDLENTDISDLTNNPSLWLGLDSTLETSEEPTLSGVPVMIEDNSENSDQVSFLNDKQSDLVKEESAITRGTENTESEAMEVDDQGSAESVIEDGKSFFNVHLSSCESNPSKLSEKKIVQAIIPTTDSKNSQQSGCRQGSSTPTQITKVVLAPHSAASSSQPILFTIPQSSSGMSLFSTNTNIRLVNASSTTKLATSGSSSSQNQQLRVLSPQKTITIQQAQHLGLISPRKGQPVVVNKLSISTAANSGSILTNKPSVKLAGGNVTLVRTISTKTPTKIAPAPLGTMQITTSQPHTTNLVIKGGSGQMTMGGVVSNRGGNSVVSHPSSPQKFVLRPATPVSVTSSQARPSSQAPQPAQYIRLTTAQALAAGIIPPPSIQGESTPQQLTLAGNKIQLVRLLTPSSTAGASGVSNVVSVGNSRLVLGSATNTSFKHQVTASTPQQSPIGKVAGSVSKASFSIKSSPIATTSNISGSQRILLPAGSVGPLSGNVVVLPASQNVQGSNNSLNSSNQATTSVVQMTNFNEQNVPESSSSPIISSPPLQIRTTQIAKPAQQPSPNPSVSPPNSSKSQSVLESNGLKPRKPCNCTKSQCLKLYCDCFANGEFCHGCNCVCCANNLEHEELRLRAIRSCLDRNPHAFKPKIGVGWGPEPRRHNKGCHCKRSGCLKNYCECYEAKIACSAICKCIGCKNCTDPIASPTNLQEKKNLKFPTATLPVNVPKETRPTHLIMQSKLDDRTDSSKNATLFSVTPSSRPPFSFITQEVVEATCQCLLAQAEEAERLCKSTVETEGLVLEEFGRCLLQIIEYASKAKVSTSP